jgi:hypothetical protein
MGIAKLQHFFFYSFSALFPAIALCLMPLFADGLQRIETILAPLDCYRSRGRIQAAIRPNAAANMAGVSVGVVIPLFVHLIRRYPHHHDVLIIISLYCLFPLPKYWIT